MVFKFNDYKYIYIYQIKLYVKSTVILRRTRKMKKATINFIMFVRLSVCLSVRMEKLDSPWTDFHEV